MVKRRQKCKGFVSVRGRGGVGSAGAGLIFEPKREFFVSSNVDGISFTSAVFVRRNKQDFCGL